MPRSSSKATPAQRNSVPYSRPSVTPASPEPVSPLRQGAAAAAKLTPSQDKSTGLPIRVDFDRGVVEHIAAMSPSKQEKTVSESTVCLPLSTQDAPS